MSKYNIYFSKGSLPETHKINLYFDSDAKVIEFIDDQLLQTKEYDQACIDLIDDSGFYFVRNINGNLSFDFGS